ncbi:hypothetical protein [Nocardioides piscis]|uniref:Lipoprotein n=1 Tax=Nocardioides piscis TaxID=2714938 RepID=A0A6G7YH01_9ACTN|nr:hypothetical protein [Nocardioides piscis]QIK76009.1 hypothetical protein G7071_11765 [Nocardioides piscis]
MNRPPRHTPYAAVLLALLAGCTATPPERSAPVPSRPTASVSPATPEALRCEEPPPALLERAEEAISTHPGPVRAAVLVEATTTETGRWSVIAVERAFVHDDGTPAGGASRSLGLTDSAAAPATARIIPLGAGPARGDPRVSWEQVRWTGEALEAGKRAASKAVECLDAGLR